MPSAASIGSRLARRGLIFLVRCVNFVRGGCGSRCRGRCLEVHRRSTKCCLATGTTHLLVPDGFGYSQCPGARGTSNGVCHGRQPPSEIIRPFGGMKEGGKGRLAMLKGRCP